MAVIARACDGGMLQRKDRMGCPVRGLRRLDCDGPCLSVRPKAERTHFTVDPDEGAADPVVA